MNSLLSMEDLFYGPMDPTWILPPPNAAPVITAADKQRAELQKQMEAAEQEMLQKMEKERELLEKLVKERERFQKMEEEREELLRQQKERQMLEAAAQRQRSPPRANHRRRRNYERGGHHSSRSSTGGRRRGPPLRESYYYYPAVRRYREMEEPIPQPAEPPPGDVQHQIHQERVEVAAEQASEPAVVVEEIPVVVAAPLEEQLPKVYTPAEADVHTVEEVRHLVEEPVPEKAPEQVIVVVAEEPAAPVAEIVLPQPEPEPVAATPEPVPEVVLQAPIEEEAPPPLEEMPLDPVPVIVVPQEEPPAPIELPYIPPPPMELRVPMCCESCVKKVKDRIRSMPGVQDVFADQYNQKVIVTGNADPALVLSYVKKAKKRSQFWDENVNYTQNYQNYIDLLDEDKKRADIARAQAVEAEEAAIAHAYLLQSQMNFGVQNVIVQLPKDDNGPNVTVILPEPNAVPA